MYSIYEKQYGRATVYSTDSEVYSTLDMVSLKWLIFTIVKTKTTSK